MHINISSFDDHSSESLNFIDYLDPIEKLYLKSKEYE